MCGCVFGYRFSQFHDLHTAVAKEIGSKATPKMPTRRIFGSSLIKKLVEKRRVQLEKFLRRLVVIHEAWRVKELGAFLDSPQQVLGRRFTSLWDQTTAKEFTEVRCTRRMMAPALCIRQTYRACGNGGCCR